MLEKYRKIILFLIIIMGFGLRFYGAKTLPLNTDEQGNVVVARGISFDLRNPKLPLADKDPEDAGVVFHRYLMRIGWYVFGESDLGGRLPFVLLGCLTILFVYLLVKGALGTSVALLAALLLSIDQFHIGISRVAEYNAPHLLFVALSLFLFYKGISAVSKNLLLLNGLVIGIGCWVKETMFFLIPIYLIFLSVSPAYRYWLKKKELWISFFIVFLLILPPVCVILAVPGAPRFYYILRVARIGLSLNSTALYLGELILLIIKPFPVLFDYVFTNQAAQLPMENFVFGIFILVAVIASIRKKGLFIRLMVVCFVFNFIVFCFLRQFIHINNIWALSSFSWSSLGFISGIVLASDFMISLLKKRVYAAGAALLILIPFIFIRTLDVATYPIACYFPAKDNCIDEVQYWLDSAGFMDKNRSGNFNDLRTLKCIYLATKNRPAYRKMAALRIGEILIKNGRKEEAREYIDCLATREPDIHENSK